MAYGRHTNVQLNRNFKKALHRRLEKLDDFPEGTEIAFRFDGGASLGVVLAHDRQQGRLIVSKDRTFDPTEITVYVVK